MPSELINVEHPFYTSPSVHREMLDDTVRTLAFKAALQELIAKKEKPWVLDIGTGSGVLAMFAAQAGAEKVFATEAEGPMFEAAKMNIQRSGLEGKVELLKYVDGRKLKLPRQVDIIVSECLGHFGFDENMITAVSGCKEYLRPNGTFLPRSVALFAALASVPDTHNDLVSTWDKKRYGLDFSAMKGSALRKIYVQTFTKDSIVSNSARLVDYKLGEQCDALNGTNIVTASKDATVHGLAGWFESKLTENIVLSTSPYEKKTHWEQVFLPMENPIKVAKGDKISVKLNVKNHSDSNEVTFAWEILTKKDNKSYSGSVTV